MPGTPVAQVWEQVWHTSKRNLVTFPWARLNVPHEVHSLRLTWKLPQGLCEWNQVFQRGLGCFQVSLGECSGKHFSSQGPTIAYHQKRPQLCNSSASSPNPIGVFLSPSGSFRARFMSSMVKWAWTSSLPCKLQQGSLKPTRSRSRTNTHSILP